MKTPFISEPTIFALATAPGRAGVAIVRISGDRSRMILEKMCSPNKTIKPRTAVLRDIVDHETGEKIDKGMVLWFPSPNSYTGEDLVEMHLHGSKAILEAVMSNLGKFEGFRIAEPGEFTRRAFENGKMDLTEAEAVADLVNAETSAQRRQALWQMEGALSNLYNDWAERLKKSLAYLEADIDFTEDELPEDLAEQQTESLQKLLTEIELHLDDKNRGERLREGFFIAILGPPNAGKSSLLNALVKREAAIVTPLPGTTRDIIETHLDLGGYPVILADTAGLRESLDIVEHEGIRRALDRAAKADLKILLFDGEKWPLLDEKTKKLFDGDSIMVVNKADLLLEKTEKKNNNEILFISAKTGEGLESLTKKLIEEIEKRYGFIDAPVLTRARHRAALEECKNHLQRALSVNDVELRAEDVRLAMRSLGRITGKVDVEDLLDIVFRDFCIGK